MGGSNIIHAFKDHCRYIKWQLVNCLFTYMIFFVRLLSVFLKHKMNTTFIMVLYLYRGAAPSITQGTFFANVRTCSSVKRCRHVDLCCPLSGYTLTSVCTLQNALSLYFHVFGPHCTIHLKRLHNGENSRTI